MNDKTDLRIQKTYLALYNAMRSLLEEKDFEEITVNELCARAMVGRGTFYKHFADKYEYLSFVIREQYSAFLEKMQVSQSEGAPEEYFLSLFRMCIDFSEHSPAVVSSLHSSKSVFLLAQTVSEIVVPDITKRLDQIKAKGAAIRFESADVAELICGALMQTVLWWFKHRETISKEDLTEYIQTIIYRLSEPLLGGQETK